jgi:simple sugar transport system ATP-binding protein
LGENGAGKTTLMKILSGLYHPDEGNILLHNQQMHFDSPRDALAAGIGMIHQHFMLIPIFSVAENLTLGAEKTRNGFLDKKAATQLVDDLSQKYGLAVESNALVSDISVGQQQRVEILKVLYRGADVIILDEPTAVLTPQEVDDLYKTVDALRSTGHTIIFISHKLNEVLRFTNRVTVLRDGGVIGSRNTVETDADELTEMMVGRKIDFKLKRNCQSKEKIALSVQHLSAKDYRGLTSVNDVSFVVHAGEVVGIAGIEGNGQTELQEALAGLIKPKSGTIMLDGVDITQSSVENRYAQGLAHIPEDRHKRGLILDFSLAENAVLGFQNQAPFASGPNLSKKKIEVFVAQLMAQFDVRAPNAQVLAGGLSGGNQQKLVLAREFARKPKLLIAAQPTRGLDVGATEFVHQQLIRICQEEAGVLLFSMDLTEIMQLSDRILVMYGGRIVAECDPTRVTEAQLGLYMTGAGNQNENN